MQMEDRPQEQLGMTIRDFNAAQATDAEIAQLSQLVYEKKILVLKEQHLSPAEYVAFGKRFGQPEPYYQPMYHHPDEPDIFVSSNVHQDGKQVGVPKTGKFWHADYSFMPKPFAITMVYHRNVPAANRGTYFINMAECYSSLPDEMRENIRNAYGMHSVRRFFKIRPIDNYRPLSEVIDEVERETPPSRHPLCIRHPVTGESILYLSEGFTYAAETEDGTSIPDGLIDELLSHCGQLDKQFEHPAITLQEFDQDDLLIWDNRTLVHCARHTTGHESVESHRLTLHDQHAFY